LVEHDDIDVVDIVTPNVVHALVALEVMKAGKHVICEKSLTMSYGQAQDMAQAAKDAEVRNGINFVYCCHPPARYARHLIQLGHIRRISHVNIALYAKVSDRPKSPPGMAIAKGHDRHRRARRSGFAHYRPGGVAN